MLTVKGGQVWCRLTPRLVQLGTHRGGASPEVARLQEEAAVAAGSAKTPVTLTPELILVT